jgi:hypothetical protein
MQARGRAATLRKLQDVFGTRDQRLELDHLDFEALITNAERSGLILTFAALVGDRSRCLDDHSRLAHEWARRAVDALGPMDSAAGHRWLQQERARVEGLVAVLDALVAREDSQVETAAPRDAGVRELVQLRQRANLQLLWLRLLAAIPEELRQPESEHRICESLAMRELELRKIGLPLLHDKLAEAFVPTPLTPEQRGIGHTIAALIERLQLTRQKWTDAKNRGDEVGGDEWAPECDPEQIVQEVDIERAARISLLYATALYCYPDAHAGAVEQQVDKVRSALGGTRSDLAVALALFWLDAVDAPDRLHTASLLLCRPGVAGVLGSLRVSPWCHRFLTQPARSGADEPDIVWSGLEACQMLQQYDSGFLTVQDIAEYSVALLAWNQNPEALGQTLEAASQRLALATRLALDCPLTSCCDETLAQVEHELLLSFAAGGVGEDVVGVAVAWCACPQGLWLELMTPRLMAAGGGEREEEMPDSGESKFALFKPQVLVKVRLSSHEAVPAVRAHLEKLAKNPLRVTAGHRGGRGWGGGGARGGESIEVVSTYVSDGSSSIHDWRQLLHVVMAAMLAAMPDANAAWGEHQESEPLPAFVAPLHTLVGKHMCHAVEIVLGAFLRAPLPHIQQLRKTMLQSMGHCVPQMKRVLDIAEERARQGVQQEVMILRALLFRRYGQAVTHLEQQWQQKHRMGSMAAHVSSALGHTPGAIGQDNSLASAGFPSAALPYVQVYMAQAAVSSQGHGAGGRSWDEAQVPESPLFAGTPILSQRRGFAPPAPSLSAHAPEPRQHSNFSITPHRLVARQSNAQTLMLGQPSPFVAPWLRGGGGGGGLGGGGGAGGGVGEATPFSSWGTPMKQEKARGMATPALTPAGHQTAVEMDEDVTFGHGRSRALGSSFFALTNSPSPAPTPTRFGIYMCVYV